MQITPRIQITVSYSIIGKSLLFTTAARLFHKPVIVPDILQEVVHVSKNNN